MIVVRSAFLFEILGGFSFYWQPVSWKVLRRLQILRAVGRDSTVVENRDARYEQIRIF